jgi:phosphoribosylamine--glycine ligase
MMRLQSDLLGLLEAAVDARLAGVGAHWDPRPCVGVVMAAQNYPGTPRGGDEISGLDAPASPDSKVFHAGTKLEGDKVVTSGGRVLCACALGETVAQAQQRAYAAAAPIRWQGEFHRHDIGWRAIAREQAG